VFLERAREALGDPSPLVRLAAASAMVSDLDPAGQDLLIGGLNHDRWEIRWWCGKLLTFLGETRGRDAVERRVLGEPDRWLREEMQRMLQAFPRLQQIRTRT
jgi:HEAT repeat protein